MPVEERKSVGKYARLGGASSGVYTYLTRLFTSTKGDCKYTVLLFKICSFTFHLEIPEKLLVLHFVKTFHLFSFQ